MNFYVAALLLGLCLVTLGYGIFISMRIFAIPDITTDGSYTLGAAITALFITNHISLALTLPAVLVAGALAGACTGFIHTRLKVNSLLSGILVMTALYSVNLMIMGRSNIPLMDVDTLFTLVAIPEQEQLSQLVILLIFVILFTVLLIWLLKTDFGIAMRATGNNETMVRAQGVNSERMKIIGLAISNALVALSGFLVAQLQGFADINMGIGIVILGLGAVMIGDTFMNWLGKNSIAWRIIGVIAGTILFRLILAGSLSLGLNPNLLKLITALFVLAVVALPGLKKQNQ
ncbi:MAG: ABC transporter permease [Bacteroidetes bacterium]|nr:ABC transporter permease [Bacteroidota bacterium]